MTYLMMAWRWRYEILISFFVFAFCFAADGCSDKAQQIEQIKTEHALELTTLRAEYQTQARKLEQQQYDQTITAINEAKKREQVLIADAARARDAVSSLSDTIETLSNTAASDAKFRDEYARTTGKLLVECGAEYSKMAETADRIANDLRAITAARR